MRKIALRLLVLVVVAGFVAGGYYLVQQIPEEESEIALAAVRHGDLVVKSHLRGGLRAVRSMVLTAPNLGSTSQITQLAPGGALAQPGDLVAEFDDSERLVRLEDAQLDVEKILQDLKKAETELEIRKSQDEVELIRAKFGVRRAELQVKKNELISAIDARKNILTLEEARRRLQKLQQDIQSRLQQREAELAVLREQLNKAQLEVDRERRRIEQARVLAPMTGLVSILDNRSSGRGGFGQTAPQIREGDQIAAGMSIAQILDLSEMDLFAKVEEVERANVREGQEVIIYLDALPGKPVTGKVKRLGNTATSNIFRGEATKKFDCIMAVNMGQLLSHVGASPEQIDRILATAKRNAELGPVAGGGAIRPQAPTRGPGQPAAARSRGAAGGGGPPSSAQGPGGERTSSGGRGGRRGGGQQLSDEQRQQLRQRMQQMLQGRDAQSLSREERQKMFQQLRQSMGVSGGRGSQGSRGEGPPGGPGTRGPGAEPGAPSGSPPRLAVPLPPRPAAGQFTAEQRENAQLPAPPQAGSDVEILLRPGLLADAEIIVENIPDVLSVPYHGVFEVAGNPVVYVWDGDRFEPRRVRLGKRAESRIVIQEGLEEGELIALENPDPAARQERERRKKKAAEAGSSRPAIPGGGGGGPPAGGSGGRRRPQSR